MCFQTIISAFTAAERYDCKHILTTWSELHHDMTDNDFFVYGSAFVDMDQFYTYSFVFF